MQARSQPVNLARISPRRAALRSGAWLPLLAAVLLTACPACSPRSGTPAPGGPGGQAQPPPPRSQPAELPELAALDRLADATPPRGPALDPAAPALSSGGAPLTGGAVTLGSPTRITGGNPDPADNSWAIYRLPTYWADEITELSLDLSGSTGEVYLGLSDYARGTWRWARWTPADGNTYSTTLAALGQRPDGAVFLVLLAPPGCEAVFHGGTCAVAPHPPLSADLTAQYQCPVKHLGFIGAALYPRTGADQRLYAVCYDYAGPTFVTEVDPAGAAPTLTYPTPQGDHMLVRSVLASDDRVYYALRESGVWYSFNPVTKAFTNLGAPPVAGWVYGLVADDAGRVWGATYDGLALVCYDTALGNFSVAVPELDSENHYPRALAYWHGRLYITLGPENMGVLVYDPATADPPEQILPVGMRGPGWTTVYVDDQTGDLQLYYLPVGEAAQYYRLTDAHDLEPVADFGAKLDWYNQGSPRLASGTAVRLEGNGQYVIHFEPEGERRVYFDCDRSSALVFKLHTGPDWEVYGGTFNAPHLFRLDPAAESLSDLGNFSSGFGQIYSMANLGGRLYLAHYPQSELTVYDPALPIALTPEGLADTAPGANPRSLGALGNFQHRPLTLLPHAGRLYLASLADYGSTTGALSYFDPADESFTLLNPFAGEALCGLALVDGELWGTSSQHLFQWDTAGDSVAYATDPLPLAGGGNTRLALDRGGMLLGLMNGDPSTLYAFDPQARATAAEQPLGLGLAPNMHHLCLATGPDGLVYGIAMPGSGGSHLFVAAPPDYTPRSLWEDPLGVTYDGFAFLGDDIYLGRGNQVLRLTLARE